MIELISEESTAGDIGTAIKLDVLTEETSVIEIIAIGPQGPPGSVVGGGTVTNFSAGDCAPLFTTTEATPTSTPALSFALSNAAAHSYLGNNTGSTGAADYHVIDYSELSGTPAPPTIPNAIFKTVSVSGQSDVVADSATDTLTLAAGSNVTITTNAGTDTVTIASAGSSSGAVMNAAAPNSTIAINVLTGSPADILSKSITYAAGDQVTMRIWGAIFNNTPAGRTIQFKFNLGALTATINLGTTNIAFSSSTRHYFYIELNCAVASTSSAWLTAYCLGTNTSAFGISIPLSATALSYFVHQRSASNLTGAQTTSVQAFSDVTTTTQSFELASWTIEKVASNP